jgi:RNA polymerase sigma-70 factor (ECF subfamily)
MYEEVLLQQRKKLIDYTRSRLGDQDLAEDIFQDSLLKALLQSGDLREADRLIPWFYSILNNVIADYYRARGLDAKYQQRFAIESQLTAETEEWTALCECFRELLPTIKPQYASLIEQLDLTAGDPDQVAQALNITPNNLKVRHHRARQALRQRLEETCRMCAEHGCLDCTCKVRRD